MIAAKPDALVSNGDTETLEFLMHRLSVRRALRARGVVSPDSGRFGNDPILAENF
jgi:hypothetical protein